MSAEALLMPGSISSIIGSIITTALNLGILARDIANAPSHIQRLCTEAESCRAMVLTIKALLYQIENDGVNQDAQEFIHVASLARALIGCQEALVLLEEELEGLVKENMRIGKEERARWIWKEEEIEQHLRSLEAHKLTLNITLNVLNIHQGREIRKQNAQLLNCIMGIASNNVLTPQDAMRYIAATQTQTTFSRQTTFSSCSPQLNSVSEVECPTLTESSDDTEYSRNISCSPEMPIAPKVSGDSINTSSENDSFETILVASRVYRKKFSKSKSPLLRSNITWSELHHSGASILSYRSRSSLPIAIALIKTRAPMAILTKNPNRLNEAFIEATKKKDTEAMSIFLEYGADVNAADGYQKNTLLHSAAIRGDIELAKALLGHGADINAVNLSFETPLHLASHHGQPKAVSLLLQYGADIEAVDGEKETALFTAVRFGKSCLEVLLDSGADMAKKNASSQTILHVAAEHDFDNSGIIRSLLNHGAGIDWVNNANQTALFSVSRAGKSHNVKVLLEAGADPRKKDISGQTALHVAAANRRNLYKLDSIKILLKHGADIDAVDNAEETALFSAARAGISHNLKVLLEAGADPRKKNTSGQTPLHVAAAGPSLDTVEAELLLKYGADIEGFGQRKGKETTLFTAAPVAKSMDFRVPLEAGSGLREKSMLAWKSFYPAPTSPPPDTVPVELLLKHGADINIVDGANETALFSAARAGQLGNLKVLLEAGADPRKKNISGQTPLEVFGGYIQDYKAFLEMVGGHQVNSEDEKLGL